MKALAPHLRLVPPPPTFDFKAYNASKNNRLRNAAKVIAKKLTEKKPPKLTQSQKELLHCLPLVFRSDQIWPHKSLQSTFEDMAEKGFCDIFRSKKVVKNKLIEFFKVVIVEVSTTQKSRDKSS